MFTEDNALKVTKGWAVASLFRKARENIQMRKYLKKRRINSPFSSGLQLRICG